MPISIRCMLVAESESCSVCLLSALCSGEAELETIILKSDMEQRSPLRNEVDEAVSANGCIREEPNPYLAYGVGTLLASKNAGVHTHLIDPLIVPGPAGRSSCTFALKASNGSS